MANGTRTKTSQRPRARNPGLILFVVLMSLGAMVSLLERYRPAAVEPARQAISTGLSGYFRPLLEVTRTGRGLALRVFDLWGVEGDYRELQRRLIYTETKLQMAEEQLNRLGRIAGLREWRSPQEIEFILADVIGFSNKGGSAEIIINRGADDDIEVGLPVVGLHGLAGIVREVHERTARVQSLMDPQSAVGVASKETRNRGIVFGRGPDAPLEFIPESENEPIEIGMELVTSGLENSVFPKGIVVGTIHGRRSNFRGVEFGVVKPAETFNAIEEVLVLQRRRTIRPLRPMEGMGEFTLDMDGGPTSPTLAADAFGTDTLTTDTLATDTLTTEPLVTSAASQEPPPC